MCTSWRTRFHNKSVRVKARMKVQCSSRKQIFTFFMENFQTFFHTCFFNSRISNYFLHCSFFPVHLEREMNQQNAMPHCTLTFSYVWIYSSSCFLIANEWVTSTPYDTYGSLLFLFFFSASNAQQPHIVLHTHKYKKWTSSLLWFWSLALAKYEPAR